MVCNCCRPIRPLRDCSSPPEPHRCRGASDDALHLLESSIKAIQSAEQVILNNIANANTVGFKRSHVLFGDESYRHVALPGQIDQQGRPHDVRGLLWGRHENSGEPDRRVAGAIAKYSTVARSGHSGSRVFSDQ